MTARDNKMEQQITVLSIGPHEYGIDVMEGNVIVNRRVVVDERFLDDIGAWEPDETAMVEETVAFLLERQTAATLPDSVTLSKVADEHSDFVPELKTRLGMT